MIAEIQSTIAAEKEKIRRRCRAEIKGTFGSYARSDFHLQRAMNPPIGSGQAR